MNDAQKVAARSVVQNLHPYVPGMSIQALAGTYGLVEADIAKLASNENPDGPGPLARAAVGQAALTANRYPDQSELVQVLAAFYNLDPENIMLGNGSNDVLDVISRTFLDHTTEAISSQYAFVVYSLVTQLAGAKDVIVPAQEHGHDLEAMKSQITDQTRVIWIANPNNPTGSFIPYDQIASFLDNVPPTVIVVLDEAYYEYLDDADRIDSTRWLQQYPNLILVRTFSKIYGLAGLRVGYALAAPAVATLLNTVRQPFNVSSVGMAGAIASLRDTGHVIAARQKHAAAAKNLIAGLKKLQLKPLHCHGNFITIALPDAAGVFQSLLERGVIVRPLANYDMPGYLRISVGAVWENQKLLAALQEILTASPAA